MLLNLRRLHIALPPQIIILRRDPPAYLVQLFWRIGACILAPGGLREAQWGHQRAFCAAGLTMDCPNSLIEISSEKSRVGHLG